MTAALVIIVVVGFALILINKMRPETQPHSEPLDESWNYDALARYTEVLVEDNALRMLTDIDAQATTVAESADLIREKMKDLLPEYAESTAPCGAGSVIQIILMTRSYFGEPLPEDLADRLVLTSLTRASEAAWSQTPTL